jgi:hypothetical protein
MLVAYEVIRMLLRSLLLSLLLVSAALATESAAPPSHVSPPTGDDRRAVLELMKRNTRKYGPDAALLQGLLLTHSLQGDAVFTAESTLVGFEQAEGHEFIAFRLASGVVLDDKRLTPAQRVEHVWHVILERTLLKYPKFQGPGDGLSVDIAYSHRPFDQIADLASLDAPGPIEHAKFYMLSADIAEFLARRIGAQEFLARSRVLLDGRPIAIHLTEATMPPRPERPGPPERPSLIPAPR